MVFEAFDLRLSRTVALKETLGQTSELRQAFKHEARLLAIRLLEMKSHVEWLRHLQGSFLQSSDPVPCFIAALLST